MDVGAGEIFVILAVVALCIACIVPVVFYCLTLQGTMNALDEANRPLPGALVWLVFVPLIGWIWLLVYALLLSSAVDKELARRNLGPGSNGITIAFVALYAASIIPYLNILTILPMFVLWILHWVKMADHRRQLLG